MISFIVIFKDFAYISGIPISTNTFHWLLPDERDNFPRKIHWGNSLVGIFPTPDKLKYTETVIVVGLIYSIQVWKNLKEF